MTSATDVPFPDGVVICDRDGTEVARNGPADELLGGALLREVLTLPSWEKLVACFAAPRTGIEVVCLDGATWDVSVGMDGPHVVVVLRDVSRYTAAAVKLTTVTHELGERQRDLQTLHDASELLGAANDFTELGESTCRLLGRYLGAAHVRARLAGRAFSWPPGRPAGEPSGTWPLSSANEGDEIAWWRTSPMTESERRLVGVIVSRVAVGLERARLLARATHLANHDPLTGLLNRAGARRALDSVAYPAALVLIDIDHFKQVNDDHGHEAGDRVLERFADVLERWRATDIVVRWGGEEFLIVLPATTADDAEEPVERLRRRVAEAVHVDDAALTFTAGISDLPGTGEFEAALRRADEALYAGKDNGRNQTVVAVTHPSR